MNTSDAAADSPHFADLVEALQKSFDARPGPPVVRLLVACSGGLDSVTLSHAAAHVAQRSHRFVALGHVDHGLRGDESVKDAEWVALLAQELGSEFLYRSVDVKARMGQGISLEMAARTLRREALTSMGHAWQADAVLLAHHEDDQVETFFLRLTRGAGPEGMAGMPSYFYHKNLLFLRPWIDAPRKTIEAAAREQHITWREDASNSDPVHRRNRVRHEVLPMLASRLNSQAASHIAHAMRLLREDNALLARSARELLHHAQRPEGRLELTVLRAAPIPILRRALARWLTEQAGEETLDARLVDATVAMVFAAPSTDARDVANGFRLVCIGNTLSLNRPATPPASSVSCWAFSLPIPGRVDIPESGHVLVTAFSRGWQPGAPPFVPGVAPSHAWISAQKATANPLSVRSWQPGDRLRPLGANGSRKVQDLFTNAKIPYKQRASIPIVVCGAEIIWIAGYHIAEGWQVAGPETPSVHLAFLPPSE